MSNHISDFRGFWNGPAIFRKLMHFGMDGPEKPKAS